MYKEKRKVMKTNESTIFYEKYRPQRVADIVLPEKVKKSFQQYVDKNDIPNIFLISSSPGTGKSASAHAIITEIGCEALWINASLERNIDLIRSKIMNFASTNSFDDKIKIVVLDEADGLTPDAQRALRGFQDEFSVSCRFILTGNYKEKIIQPLIDRMEVYDFNDFSKKDMVKPIFDRLKFILDNEKIEYDPKNLVPVINTYYPSIRSMVGALQKFSGSGTFSATESDLDNVGVFENVMNYLIAKDYENLILAVNDLNSPEGFYGFMYRDIKKYFNMSNIPQVTITIAKYQHMNDTVRDKHLNLAACLAELFKI